MIFGAELPADVLPHLQLHWSVEILPDGAGSQQVQERAIRAVSLKVVVRGCAGCAEAAAADHGPVQAGPGVSGRQLQPHPPGRLLRLLLPRRPQGSPRGLPSLPSTPPPHSACQLGSSPVLCVT